MKLRKTSKLVVKWKYIIIQGGMKLRKPSKLMVNWKYIIIQGGDETQKTIKIGGKLKVHYHSRGGWNSENHQNWCGKLSFILSFLFCPSASSTVATYNFTAPNCTGTIISLEPCALNAEYLHAISYTDLLKMSLLWGYHFRDKLNCPTKAHFRVLILSMLYEWASLTKKNVLGWCPKKIFVVEWLIWLKCLSTCLWVVLVFPFSHNEIGFICAKTNPPKKINFFKFKKKLLWWSQSIFWRCIHTWC